MYDDEYHGSVCFKRAAEFVFEKPYTQYLLAGYMVS
jgi:hypothetical protein